MVAIADNSFPSIVRTERGLTVSGRRLTLYLLEDHFRAGWPPQLIKQWFDLSDQEIADVVGFRESHRAALEDEYQEVLQNAEQHRRYWDDQNRERLNRVDQESVSPEIAAKRALLEELRNRHHS